MTNEYLQFSTILFVAILAPGTDTLTLISRYLYSKNSISFFLSGIILAKITLFSFVFWGAGLFIREFEESLLWLQFIGAGYLIWLGFNMFFKNKEHKEGHSGYMKFRLLATSYILGVSNIQAIFFYMAILPLAVDLNDVSLKKYIILCAIVVSITLVVGFVYIQIAKHAEKIVGKHVNKINKLLAPVVILLAILLLIKGLS